MDKKENKKQNNNTDMIVGVASAFIILALIIGLVWYFADKDEGGVNSAQDSSQEQQADIDVVKLVEDMNKSDIVLYYSETCPHCQDQIALFDDHFKDFKNVVNCTKDQDACNVQYVPTWKYNGKEEVGVKTLQELREIVDSLKK